MSDIFLCFVDLLGQLLDQSLDTDDAIPHVSIPTTRSRCFSRHLFRKLLTNAMSSTLSTPNADCVRRRGEGAADLAPLAIPATSGALSDFPPLGIGRAEVGGPTSLVRDGAHDGNSDVERNE